MRLDQIPSTWLVLLSTVENPQQLLYVCNNPNSLHRDTPGQSTATTPHSSEYGCAVVTTHIIPVISMVTEFGLSQSSLVIKLWYIQLRFHNIVRQEYPFKGRVVFHEKSCFCLGQQYSTFTILMAHSKVIKFCILFPKLYSRSGQYYCREFKNSFHKSTM